ncbi:MAG: ABC transporter ATP-binding protein [Firmicutes bacterium]|nr:ABC transporter ATP-binding protein [Bacillota bacterium]
MAENTLSPLTPGISTGSILQTAALTKRYGSHLALDGLTFSLPTGGIIGLLGPNGSGKTTLLKLACGLLQPTTGQILIDGQPPGIHSKSVTAYLPEKSYLNDWMRVEQLITFFSEFYADFRTQKAYEMLQALGINPRARLKTLSKGTQEKVQLILVMSREAKLYLLDEPIGGVDPAAREYIVNTIIGNYNADATVLISTHIITDIEQVLDEVIFLNQGKITLQSAVDDIRAEHGKSIDEMFREVFRC